jgi:hypothetical protein
MSLILQGFTGDVSAKIAPMILMANELIYF